MPILRTVRGANVILVGPLPRYAVDRCCADTSHITNFGDSDYLAQMADKLKNLAKNIKNLTFMRRLKGGEDCHPYHGPGVPADPPGTLGPTGGSQQLGRPACKIRQKRELDKLHPASC